MTIEELSKLIAEYKERNQLSTDDAHVRVYGSEGFTLVHYLVGGKWRRVAFNNLEELINHLKN